MAHGSKPSEFRPSPKQRPLRRKTPTAKRAALVRNRSRGVLKPPRATVQLRADLPSLNGQLANWRATWLMKHGPSCADCLNRQARRRDREWRTRYGPMVGLIDERSARAASAGWSVQAVIHHGSRCAQTKAHAAALASVNRRFLKARGSPNFTTAPDQTATRFKA